jgi:hypothetical protein
MNDDELSARAELASAFLDNELEPDQRAAVAADPDLMATVQTYTRLRNTVGDVPPASVSNRAAALSAALAEFDAAHAQAATAAPVSALAMFRRRRAQYAYRIVGVAAAALVGVVAIAAVVSNDSGDQKSSATVPAEIAAADTGQRNKAPEATEAPGILSMEAAPPAVDTPEALLQFAVAQTAMAADSSASAPAAASGSATSSTAATGAGGAEAPTMDALPATASSCVTGEQTLIGPITVLGAPAYAIQDGPTGELRAVDATDCHVLFSVTP